MHAPRHSEIDVRFTGTFAEQDADDLADEAGNLTLSHDSPLPGGERR
jgi:hypothetical protein